MNFLLKNDDLYSYGHGERVGCMANMALRTLVFYREAPDGTMLRLEGCVVDRFPEGARICPHRTFHAQG